jgi:glycosyltransferase involved in cell wall biosynthesis
MADVCVMPSRSEPFGLVALESLLEGTPCIMPRQAGVAEVVRNAFKVDHWDVDDIADKVVAILRHRPLRDELSERGRDGLALPRFSLAEPARLTEHSYQRALAGAGDIHA